MLPPFATRSSQADQPGIGKNPASGDIRYPVAHVPVQVWALNGNLSVWSVTCNNFGLSATQPVWPGQCNMNP